MNKHLKTIMSKMCEYVDTTLDRVDTKQDGWYGEYTWTPDDMKEFMKWLADYLCEHKPAQKELYGYVASKKINRERASMFVFSYGWKTRK